MLSEPILQPSKYQAGHPALFTGNVGARVGKNKDVDLREIADSAAGQRDG
jgi:hypothetical protein